MKNNVIKSLLLQAIIFTVLFSTMFYLTVPGHNYNFWFNDNELQVVLFYCSPILIFVYYMFGIFVLKKQKTLIKNFVSVFPVTLIGLILWAISFLTTDFSGITCPDCQYPRYGIFKLIYDSYTLPFKLISSFLTNVFLEVIINSDISGKEYHMGLNILELIESVIPSFIFLTGIYVKGMKIP